MTEAALRPPRKARAGFTLIEVLAVIFLTTLLLAVALDFYVDLSNASTRAAESTRELRMATALLDRVARDLQTAVLVRKPENRDPLAHPWIFVAEPRFSETGADHLKFVSRGRVRPRSEGHESDLAMVAYLLRRSPEADGYELLRWSSPRLPEGLDRDYPLVDDPGVALLADGLASFGMRFLGQTGEWVDRWDSSQLLESSELPLEAEIEVALLSDGPAGFDEFGELEPEPFAYTRRVRFPLRPIDLEALLERDGLEEDEEGEDDEDGLTVAECVDFGKLDGEMDLASLAQAADAPFSEYRALFADNPAVRAECR